MDFLKYLVLSRVNLRQKLLFLFIFVRISVKRDRIYEKREIVQRLGHVVM